MVKRIFNGGFAGLCLLTIASTDYSRFGAWDIIVIASMGAAVLAKIIYTVTTRRKQKA
jgi:hypothetical protein